MAAKKSTRSHPGAARSKKSDPSRTARQRARRASDEALSNQELDALYQSFLQQPAQLSREEMQHLERRLCTADAQWRTLALASLTKSGAELKQRFATTREAAQLAAELLTVAEDMGKRLHELAGMLETASTRLMLSLCERPDMHELIASAKAQLQHGVPPADGTP